MAFVLIIQLAVVFCNLFKERILGTEGNLEAIEKYFIEALQSLPPRIKERA